jgi:hypothetical protein
MISVKQIYTGFLCLVVITLLIFSIPLTGQVNKITITGTVEGLEFDDNDNVLEVGIVVPPPDTEEEMPDIDDDIEQ